MGKVLSFPKFSRFPYNLGMQNLNAYRDAIQEWYHKHGRRELPWRNTDNAYHIYISEIMLQQTQVKTVMERFYFPFLERFPTLKELADTDLKSLMQLWQGLGYYNRARNLHQAAKACEGTLPDKRDGLIALPGIGLNTAHAILCFGFHQPYPVLEANVKRLFCRLHRITDKQDKALWNHAWENLDCVRAFDYNQALMDIGNLICTPKNPDCQNCPVQSFCEGISCPEKYPARKTRKKTKTVVHNIVIPACENRFFISMRESKLLGGLYGFPETHNDQISFADQTWNLCPKNKLGEIKHVYSHFTRQATVYLLPLKTFPQNLESDFYTQEELQTLPSSSLEKKILQLLPL